MLGCIQPISSPMMKRMLGFCCGCDWARAEPGAAEAAHNAAKPNQAERLVLMVALLQVSCRAAPGSGISSAGNRPGTAPPRGNRDAVSVGLAEHAQPLFGTGPIHGAGLSFID